MAKCKEEIPEGFELMGCDESGHSAWSGSTPKELFKGSLVEHFYRSYELEYSSSGLSGSIRGRKRNKALKNLIERLRADADYIEKHMINESTNQG